MVAVDQIRQALAQPLTSTDLSGVGELYRGKVRDNYSTGDGRRYIVTSDRISAFDRVLGTLPLKGQVLNWVTRFWFETTSEIAPNHLLAVPDPNVLEVRECAPLPVELVVRSYLTGVTSTSIWHHYENGSRNFCGHPLPDGMVKNQPLDAPIVTPSTKAAKGDHDVSMGRDELIERGIITPEDFDAAADIALRLFAFGQRHCAAQGLILVDTKYEIGKDADGTLRVIDEMHTPDSSRFWYRESYEQRFAEGQEPESFDKEYVRRWLAEQGFKGDGPIPEIPADVKVEAMRRYIEACETIVGSPFVPDLSEPIARIERALAKA